MFRTASLNESRSQAYENLFIVSLLALTLIGCTSFSPTAARVYDLPRYYTIDDVPNARKLTADDIRAEYIGVDFLGWSPVVAQSKTKRYILKTYEPGGHMRTITRKVYGDIRCGSGASGSWVLHEDGTFTTYNSYINNATPLGVRHVYFADDVYYEVDINSDAIRYKFVKL